MARVRLMIVMAGVMALFATAAGAHAASFTTPVKLTGPGGGNSLAGGEPSIADDGRGNVYVDGPQGIPSGLNGEPGIGFWVSRDNGSTFGAGRNLGSYLGGGDSDVVTTSDATVYIADLEAAASQVCKSTDKGNTFDSVGPTPDPSHCSTVGEGQVGPSDDRQWLTPDPTDVNRVYLTYHEFVSAQPLAFRTDNGGTDNFANPCGSIVTDPAIEANVPTDITGGTLVAKPVVDAAGNLYVLFATTTQAQNAQAFANGGASGTFSQLYLAVSHDHCATFTDHTVYDGSQNGSNNTQFGDIFNTLSVDGAGNLYSVAAGYVKSNTPAVANVYMFSSTDHGQHWSKPNLIGSTNAAHMLPAAVAGRQGGQLAIGYFQTTNGKTDPNDLGGQWTYTTAESANAASASPTFTYADVNPGFIYHHGQICNEGILCGAPGQPSDRSLLDFTSATADSAGCPLFTFAANPTGTPTTNDNAAGSPTLNTFNYVTRQLTGCFQSATATTASGGGAATASTPGAAVFGSPLGRRRTGGAHGHTVACVASKRLLFHINPVPGGFVVKAVAYVNGHKVAQRRGRQLKTIAFRRPRGSRLNVKIVTTNNKGGRVITTRSFIGCRTKTRVNGRTHRHKVRHKKKHK